MTGENREKMLEHLARAMSELYLARHRAAGPAGPTHDTSKGKLVHYPEMDAEIFSDIAEIQTKLSVLTGKVRKKGER